MKKFAPLTLVFSLALLVTELSAQQCRIGGRLTRFQARRQLRESPFRQPQFGSRRFGRQNPRLNPAATLPVGTWQADDRILTVLPGSRFRVYWMDQSVVQIDQGSYTVVGGQIRFQSELGDAWPWQLVRSSSTSLTLSHSEVGRKTFRKINVGPTNGLVGNYNARYRTNRGVSGNSDVSLFEDGVYVIDEFLADGSLHHSEMGIWQASADRLVLEVHHNGRYQQVPARMVTTQNGFALQYTSLAGPQYVYLLTKS